MSQIVTFPKHEVYAVDLRDQAHFSFLRSIYPDMKFREHDDGIIAALPLNDEAFRLLTNLGYETSGYDPIRHIYDVPKVEGEFDAMPHQLETAAFYAKNPRCFNLSTMRTGKTAADILATEYLMQRGLMSGAQLIVCTVSNLGGVWEDTIKSTLPHRKVVRLHGGTGAKDRRDQFKQRADYYLINYDGVKMIEHDLARAVTEGRIGGVTVDELTHMKNVSSARWKSMNMVINGGEYKLKNKPVTYTPVKFARGLTGTPGSDPENVYGYVRLINPKNMQCSPTAWKHQVKYRWGSEAWQWSLRENFLEEVEKVFCPTIRFNKDDIMTLPPVMKSIKDAPLSEAQMKIYNKLKRDMLMQLESGEQIVASKQSALVSKLLQVAAGAVISTDRDVVKIDMTPKLNALWEIIEGTDRKVVVFGAFTGVLSGVAEAVRAKGYTCEVVDGSVTSGREQIFHDFQYKADPHVLVCHPMTTAFGVELAAADTLVFFGPPLSGDFVYSQAIERASSMKQTSDSINIYHILSTPEERHILSMIEKGVGVGTAINNLYEQITKSVV